MKIRFVGPKKQDSATIRRRSLRAIRTRNCRNRQKARKDLATANRQPERQSLIVNELSRLENSSIPDLRGVEDDIPILDTEGFEENDASGCEIFPMSDQNVDDLIISTIKRN
jgi:hypothetical protein